MSKFAADTQVSPERSRAEIERTLQRYGATGFYYGSENNQVILGFRAQERVVRFVMPLPWPADFVKAPSGKLRTERQLYDAHSQAVRTRWRCLALAIKAKLEVVESGISTFEEEFLAHIVTHDGATVGQKLLPQIDEQYRTGKNMPLMLGPKEAAP